MANTNPDLSLSLYLPSFSVPSFEDKSLAYVDENGIHLFTGGNATNALKSTPIPQIEMRTALNGIENLVPQTITLSYVNLHLLAGMTVNINSNFATVDNNYNDFSFAYLQNTKGGGQTALLQDEKYFSQNYAKLTTGYDKLYTLFNGVHTGQHFTVSSTGDYTLVLGVADVSDKTGTSGVTVTDVSIGLPGTLYTVSVADAGLKLTDGTVVSASGVVIPPGGSKAVYVLAPGAAGYVTAIYSTALSQTLFTTGGGLYGSNAGGDINPAAGGLPSLTTLVNVPGSGLVATNASGLIGIAGTGLVASGGGNLTGTNLVASGAGNLVASGAGNLFSQDGGGVISNDGGSLISQDGGGLISQDGGSLISQDGGGLIGQDGGSLASSGGTALFTKNGIGGAGDIASTGGADTGTGIAFATAPLVRTYTLTGDPGVAPATPPKAVGEGVAGPVSDANTQYSHPAVAGLSDGRYVTVWSDNLFSQDRGVVSHNGSFEIRGQIYSADGSKSGGVFDISQFGGVNQIDPSVTGLSDGRFVVTYTGVDLSLGRSNDVFAQFYNADGTKNGSRVPVNTAKSGDQGSSVVASLSGGGAVVVFETPGPNGVKLLAQLYAADGTAQGGNIAVGPNPTSREVSAAAAGLQNGGFVIAYNERIGPGPEYDGIYMQRFDATGVSQGVPVLVNTTIDPRQATPGVAVLTDGSYVVSWLNDPAGRAGIDPFTINAQRFSAAGVKIDGEITVASDPFFPTVTPSITALHDGGYAISWETQAPLSPFTKNVSTQIFSADGTKQGAPFDASPPDPATSFVSPASTTLLDGKLLVLGVRTNGATGSGQVLSEVRADTFSFPTTPTAPTIYGRVIDGIVKGATVFADANGNGVLDAGEASATTDAFGRYTFTTPASGTIVARGGTDVSTGLPFTQTYTAPAGSLSITALSTLVQKVMATTGGTLGDAVARVNVALGLPIGSDVTALNPITDVLNGAASQKALVVDAVLNDTLALASAAGARGDLYANFASQITNTSYGTFDPTATASIQGLGLSQVDAFGVSILAEAGATLLEQKLADTAATPRSLVNDVTSLQTLQQGAEAAELRAATAQGTTGPLINKYTGDNLNVTVAASSAAAAGDPYDFAYTDVTTAKIGYARGDTYTGPVANLAKQYIWNSADKVNIAAASANVFLHGGAGDDALLVSAGTNVLDGSAGSNFLVGGKGASQDTFFVDGRGGLVTWSTIVNFHPGDAATIFGFKSGTSTLPFTAVDGVTGYQGLTIHSELAGAGTGVNASMTFAGITQADADAHFTITADTLAKGTANATDYLLVQYNK